MVNIINTILLSCLIGILCIVVYIGNRYFKGWVAFEIYKNNQMFVDKVINKDALQYYLPGFELPNDPLQKEIVRVYYRDMYAWYGTLYELNKQGMLLSGEWESIESCLKGNISQNKSVREYAQMIADGRRVWPKDYQIYIRKILNEMDFKK